MAVLCGVGDNNVDEIDIGSAQGSGAYVVGNGVNVPFARNVVNKVDFKAAEVRVGGS